MHSKKHWKVIHSAVLRPQDWLRFVQIDPFPGQWHRLKLAEIDLEVLEVLIMMAPLMAPTIKGTGGLRKIRFAPPDDGKGKSGGYRVFYVYFEEYGTVILWAIIDKGQVANLSKARRNAISQQITRLKRLLDEGAIR